MIAVRSCGAASDGGHIDQPGNLGDRLLYRGGEGGTRAPARAGRVRLDGGRESTVARLGQTTAKVRVMRRHAPLPQPCGPELRESRISLKAPFAPVRPGAG